MPSEPLSTTAASRRPALRAVLFVPGNHRHRMEKALALDVDGVILDLEDAVLPDAKEAARAEVAAFLGESGAAEAAGSSAPGSAADGRRPHVCVRVNHWRSGWTDLDLNAAVRPGVDSVMLAKAESAADVEMLAAGLLAREVETGLPPGSLRIIPLIESAAGILAAAAIAAASPRVLCLGLGGLDFAQEIGTRLSPGGEELLLARSQLVLACSAAGVGPPLDTVYPHLNDPEGLRRDAARARQLGFGGKLVIHPDQVAPVREAFRPAADEIRQAREILAAFAAARAAGSAVVRLADGRFADRPVILWAERVLAQGGEEAPSPP